MSLKITTTLKILMPLKFSMSL